MLFLTFPCDNKSTYSYANMFIYRCFIDSLECIIPETYCTYYIRY